MTAMLDELGLTALSSIYGMSALPGALIFPRPGSGPVRPGRAVQSRRLNPSERTSATMNGRPGSPSAAARAAVGGLARGLGALRHNRVPLAKHARWTSRTGTARRRAGPDRIAATLLRWLWAVITRQQPWDARIAAGVILARPGTVTIAAAA